MCEEIIIMGPDGEEMGRCETINDLTGFMPIGIFDEMNERIDPLEQVNTQGEQFTNGDMCLCTISKKMTAFRNRYLYSHIDPAGRFNPFDGFFYPMVRVGSL